MLDLNKISTEVFGLKAYTKDNKRLMELLRLLISERKILKVDLYGLEEEVRDKHKSIDHIDGLIESILN